MVLKGDIAVLRHKSDEVTAFVIVTGNAPGYPFFYCINVPDADVFAASLHSQIFSLTHPTFAFLPAGPLFVHFGNHAGRREASDCKALTVSRNRRDPMFQLRFDRPLFRFEYDMPALAEPLFRLPKRRSRGLMLPVP